MSEEWTRRDLLKRTLGFGAATALPLHALPLDLLSQTGSSRNEIWRMGAGELARAIREKKISSREAVQAHLDRIAAVNPKLRAVTVVLADSALASAEKADQALARGTPSGPLHGVPMTVKENIDLVGSATTQGVAALAQNMPPTDSPRIVLLRNAGAIALARTNLPDFGMRWHTDSHLHGATVNPWDPKRTPGGSSGGDAVALATGMTPLGNGNDYGGSLRYPAQCCGVVSIRPSRGRVPHHLAQPGEPPLTLQMFAVEGPMARRVADLRLALSVMSAADARDPWWTPAPLQGAPPSKPIKVAMTGNPGGSGVHPDVAEGVRKAAKALQNAGYTVEEADPPAVEEGAMLWSRLVSADIRNVLWPPVQGIVSEGAKTFMNSLLARIPESNLGEYIEGFARRNRIAREWSRFFERYPLVLGPVSTEPPFAVGRDVAGSDAAWSIFLSMRLVVLMNLLGLPAAAVPSGVINGLPQSVQIIGPMFREDLCLDAAEAVERALGTLTPIEPR